MQFKIAPPIINDQLVENLGVLFSSIQIFAIPGVFLALSCGAVIAKVGALSMIVFKNMKKIKLIIKTLTNLEFNY